VKTVKCLHALALLLALFWSSPLWAVQPNEVLADPTLESRARALSKELRCMVCQNESIDDSDAPLAHDLRVLVRERITAGDSNAQVLDFLVARYGEFVLLRPRLSWHTAALWGLPPAILLFGVAMLVAMARRRNNLPAAIAPADLTAVEQVRVDELIRGEGAP
jgi:cytochrome c-type biogenesis protein CcmH